MKNVNNFDFRVERVKINSVCERINRTEFVGHISKFNASQSAGPKYVLKLYFSFHCIFLSCALVRIASQFAIVLILLRFIIFEPKKEECLFILLVFMRIFHWERVSERDHFSNGSSPMCVGWVWICFLFSSFHLLSFHLMEKMGFLYFKSLNDTNINNQNIRVCIEVQPSVIQLNV